jgi:hypothetical protein
LIRVLLALGGNSSSEAMAATWVRSLYETVQQQKNFFPETTIGS